MSGQERLYWLGFAVAAKQAFYLRGNSAVVLTTLVRANGASVPANTFPCFSKNGGGEPMKLSSIKPAIHFARDALADCGLAARIVTERGPRGEGVSLYRLEGAAAVKAFVEGGEVGL